MKLIYILMTIVNRISLTALLLAVVLGVVFIPMADNPMPALEGSSFVAAVSGILFWLSRVLVTKSKEAIILQMKNSKS